MVYNIWHDSIENPGIPNTAGENGLGYRNLFLFCLRILTEDRVNPFHVELRTAVVVIDTVLFLFNVCQLGVAITPYMI